MRHVLLLLALIASPALAQVPFPVPGKPITLMSGFVAGTQGDIYLRLVAPHLQAALGVPVAVEARFGAGGNVAMEATARAAPDGHSVLMVTSGQLAVNPALFQRMPVDTQRDLAPIMTLFDAPNVIVVSTAARPAYGDCPALVAAIRARPGRLNYASSGVGASTHLAAAQFLRALDLDMVHVPYRGGPAAMIGLFQGDVEMFLYQTGQVIEDWRAGRVRLLGITAAERVAALPEVPTVAEACGLPGFQTSVWWGLVAPARTPVAVTERLRQEFARITAMPDITRRMTDMGFTMMINGPEEMRSLLDRDIPRWADVVRATGARAE
jgi:tripartite-type tricarboxylate transporter receptor subunit TctC